MLFGPHTLGYVKHRVIHAIILVTEPQFQREHEHRGGRQRERRQSD